MTWVDTIPNKGARVRVSERGRCCRTKSLWEREGVVVRTKPDWPRYRAEVLWDGRTSTEWWSVLFLEIGVNNE